MALVPKLDRLTRMDVGPNADPVREMAIWQNLCEGIEGAFTEIVDLLIVVATKNGIYVQGTEPTGATFNDLWLDTSDGNKPHRWNGTAWEAVQDVGAEYALVAINPDGTIANDKVVNDSVLAGAVIGADASYTATSTEISAATTGPFNTYVNVGTKGFTSTGNEVQIAVAARIEVIDNCKIIYRLLCDGVQVEDAIGPVTVNAGDQAPLSFIWAHTPAAGAHTYDVEVQVNNNGIIVHNTLIGPNENRNL